MRNNPVFLRVITYIDDNNLTKAQILAATDEQFLAVMYPPSGIRPANDFTAIRSVKAGLVHVYKERKQAARISQLYDDIKAEFPSASVMSQGGGRYIVDLGDNDE